jgi:hypothetical protein
MHRPRNRSVDRSCLHGRVQTPSGVVAQPHRLAAPRRLGSLGCLEVAQIGSGGTAAVSYQPTTMTTVALLTTSPTRPFAANLAWSRRLPAPGGQGRAVVAAAVSWWNGYRRAGGHRLFTANDREPTGIARFLSGVRDSQSGCRTMRKGNNRDCQDTRIANPLVGRHRPAARGAQPSTLV